MFTQRAKPIRIIEVRDNQWPGKWSSTVLISASLWFIFSWNSSDLTIYSLPVTWCTTSLTLNNCTVCPHCIYVFCIYLRTNSDLCHLEHKQIGFYNRDEKCLQRGTDWVFKYSHLWLVFKGLSENKVTLDIRTLTYSPTCCCRSNRPTSDTKHKYINRKLCYGKGRTGFECFVRMD